ncbi:MAG: hypothetical protein FJ276_19895 [Planctomycetes bacterium]|nr:hypothetical protein [Planctomycetota bacterium]
MKGLGQVLTGLRQNPGRKGGEVTDDRGAGPTPSRAQKVPRIDPAHGASADHLPAHAPPGAELVRAIAGQSACRAEVQLQQQAAELSQHLRERHSELARWEAVLNAQSAQCEGDRRATRLWLREQQAELDQREVQLRWAAERLAREHTELQTLRATHQALELRQQTLEQREHSVRQEEVRLQRELQAVQHQASGLDVARAEWERQRAAEQQALIELQQSWHAEHQAARALNAELQRQLDERRDRAFETGQSMAVCQAREARAAALDLREAELSREYADFQTGMQSWRDKTHRQRLSLANLWRRQRRLLHKQRLTLRRLSDQVERKGRALHALREELTARQQEMLETCLVLEQFWTGLEGQVTPDELAGVADRIRGQLTGLHAADDRARDEQRQELRRLAEEIAQQQHDLNRHRNELQQWAARRELELKEQMRQLSTREQEVRQQERHLAEARRDWRRLSRQSNAASHTGSSRPADC